MLSAPISISASLATALLHRRDGSKVDYAPLSSWPRGP